MRTWLPALLIIFSGLDALAQEPWPSRPVTLIVPHAAGVTPDVVARILAERLAAPFGQPVVVINRPGSNGLIGGEAAARSRPDGHTLLIGDDALVTISPHLYPSMTFSPEKDFVPILSLVENQFFLVVRPDLPVTNLQSFFEYARQANPALAYGSNGQGSQSHLTMERLRGLAGVELLHVPYRTASQSATAIVTGEISVAFIGSSALSLVRSGKLRALASTGPMQSKSFPDVPPLNRSYPGFEMTNWQGLFAPAGTPQPILARIEQEVRAILTAEGLQERLAGGSDLRILLLGAAEFTQRIRRDSDRYREIVDRLGLKID